jgi:hypothetical protein
MKYVDVQKLAHDIVTGSGLQLENLSMSPDEFKVDDDGNLEIVISLDEWLSLIELAKGARPALPKDGYVFFPVPGMKPCAGCGQPTGAQLRVSRGGFMCGSAVEHERDCPTNFCRHGKRCAGADAEDCAECDADRVDEGDDC